MRDTCALLGLALVGSGCYLVTPALACIVVGSLLLVAGIVSHFMTPRGKPDDS